MTYGINLGAGTAAAIVRAMSQRTGVPEADLVSGGRKSRKIAHVRWLVMREMRDRRASLPTIARHLRMNHSSVHNGLCQLEKQRAEHPQKRVDRLAQCLAERRDR
jgi:chromosomal replication initiation ATPase DnaA